MFLIGIAGGSGSGKTTFAQKIRARASDPRVAVLNQDSYYLPEPAPHLTDSNGKANFDHPEAFDWNYFKFHLGELKRDAAIEVPIYDYRTSRRTFETTPLGPCKVVIVEGIYTLYDKEVFPLFDLKIYLDVDADIRFIRRLHRDVHDRGRTVDSIIRQYYDTVRPMHRAFLEPSQQNADLIVGEESDVAAETIAARIRDLLTAQAKMTSGLVTKDFHQNNSSNFA